MREEHTPALPLFAYHVQQECTRLVDEIVSFAQLVHTAHKDLLYVFLATLDHFRGLAHRRAPSVRRDSFGGRRALTTPTTQLALPRVRQATTAFAT